MGTQTGLQTLQHAEDHNNEDGVSSADNDEQVDSNLIFFAFFNDI